MARITFTILLLVASLISVWSATRVQSHVPVTAFSDIEITINNESSVNVHISKYEGVAHIYIYDETGSVVLFDSTVVEGSIEKETDINDLEAGIYIIVIETENGIFSDMFVQ